MIKFLQSRWLQFLALLIFIILKVPHLFYSYYWDESLPYAVAIKEMYRHGASLMPSAIDPEFSRGHPLLFHALAALWMNIFGTSHVALHSFALTISVLLLTAIYETGLRLFNRRVATLALFLVATLLVFFIQSSFVLLEVFLALLCFLSLVFYVQRKYLLTAVCLTACFYTKESGLVMGVLLGTDALVSLFNKQHTWKERVNRLVAVMVPCVLILIFFLVQKQVRGWYLFPGHSGSIELRWNNVWYNFRRNGLKNTFDDMSKYYYYLLLLAMSVLAAVKSKSVKYLVLFLPGILIYIMIHNDAEGNVQFSIPLLALFFGSVIAMLYLFRRLQLYATPTGQRFMTLSVAFILLFIAFSAINFFTYRYLLPVLILLFLLVAVMLDWFVQRSFPVLFVPVLLLILVIAWNSYCSSTTTGDADPAAFAAMDVQQKEVDYVVKNNFYHKAIACGSCLTRSNLINPDAGFLDGVAPLPAKNVRWDIDNATQIVLFDNADLDYRYEAIKNDTNFRRIYRYENGRLWTEIYERK